MSNSTADRHGRSDGMRTVDRALSILSLFQEDAPEWTATEVAQATGLTLPTVSRFLRALADRGFLMRLPGRRYRLGFAAIELGTRATRTLELRSQLQLIVRKLARASACKCVLVTLTERRDAAVVIDSAEGWVGLQLALEVGHTWPLHVGATARVLLAYMSEPEVEFVLSQPMAPAGPQTITDRSQLARSLTEIRDRRGWTFGEEESGAGIWGIAAVVLDRAAAPVCSLGLIGPLDRRSSAEERRLAALMTKAIDDVRNELGLAD